MIIKRGTATDILIMYASFDSELTYELSIKGCDEAYELTLSEAVCGHHILFSVTIPCTHPTGVFEYELLEDSITVQEGTLFIND